MVKKFILLAILMLFSVYCSIDAYAATWSFRWTNTIVHIPLGAELERYKDKPTARLYKDGVILADADITYSYKGDWLYFLKDVDTSRVGSYNVWYKAFETDKYRPGTCTGYKTLVTFIVEDLIKPEIIAHNNTIYIDRGSIKGNSKEEIDKELRKNITIKDNYSEPKLELIHSIDTLRVGEYEVKCIATDESMNTATAEFKVNVIEKDNPVISFLGTGDTLKLPLNSTPDLRKYFKAWDKIHGDISADIIFPPLDTGALDKREYTVSLIKDGLKASYTIAIEIVDDVKPQIILKDASVILDYKTDFTSYDFLIHFDKVEDNLPFNRENLVISHNIENKVGKYLVDYIYNDGVYEAKSTLEVILNTEEKPIIEIDDIKIPEGEVIDLKNFVAVFDPSDSSAIGSLRIDDSNVIYTKPGTYFAKAYCTNSSGQTAEMTFRVIVEPGINGEIGLLITVGIMGAVIIGLTGFIIYYFVVRKKQNTI